MLDNRKGYAELEAALQFATPESISNSEHPLHR
jgi:hypothetical protein